MNESEMTVLTADWCIFTLSEERNSTRPALSDSSRSDIRRRNDIFSSVALWYKDLAVSGCASSIQIKFSQTHGKRPWLSPISLARWNVRQSWAESSFNLWNYNNKIGDSTTYIFLEGSRNSCSNAEAPSIALWKTWQRFKSEEPYYLPKYKCVVAYSTHLDCDAERSPKPAIPFSGEYTNAEHSEGMIRCAAVDISHRVIAIAPDHLINMEIKSREIVRILSRLALVRS